MSDSPVEHPPLERSLGIHHYQAAFQSLVASDDKFVQVARHCVDGRVSDVWFLVRPDRYTVDVHDYGVLHGFALKGAPFQYTYFPLVRGLAQDNDD